MVLHILQSMLLVRVLLVHDNSNRCLFNSHKHLSQLHPESGVHIQENLFQIGILWLFWDRVVCQQCGQQGVLLHHGQPDMQTVQPSARLSLRLMLMLRLRLRLSFRLRLSWTVAQLLHPFQQC